MGDLGTLEGVKLDTVLTIVDAASIIRFPSIGHTGKIQIELADIILLNKVDLLESDQINQVREKVKMINDSAIIYPTSYCDIDFRLLFGIETKKVHSKKVKHDHLKEEQLESFNFAIDKTLDRGKFESFLNSVPKEIYRAKGFVRFSDGVYLFNFVAGRWDLEKFEAGKTELVFIGKDILKFEENIKKELLDCMI